MKHKRTYLFKNTVSQNADGAAKVIFSGPGDIEMGPAAEFGGSGKTLNPEEMFVAAANGCLMNTFFYFTKKFDIEILSYNSQASGQLEKQADGFRFTNVKVQAKAKLSDDKAIEKVNEAGKLAEKYCLVSRSIACPVVYKLEIEIDEK